MKSSTGLLPLTFCLAILFTLNGYCRAGGGARPAASIALGSPAGAASVTGRAATTEVHSSADFPERIETDGAGNVYVTDFNNNTVRMFSPDGVATTLAGPARQQRRDPIERR
jgi:hypothetical protein